MSDIIKKAILIIQYVWKIHSSPKGDTFKNMFCRLHFFSRITTNKGKIVINLYISLLNETRK